MSPMPGNGRRTRGHLRLSLEQQFRGQGRTVEVNRWLELDGNNIRIVDLELYPTHARLNLEQDPDNAEELQSLDFYLEDKKGNRYEKAPPAA